AMQAESWYTAEEAVAAGLADEWDGSTDVEASAEASIAAARDGFRFRGRAHAPAPILGVAVAASVERSSPTGPGEVISGKELVVDHDEFMAALRDRLGVTDAEASLEQILDVVAEL